MEIKVQEVEACKLNIQYIADAGEILNKRGEVLSHFKKAPVPGFRKDKAPIDAIKMHYRPQIEDALKRALAEDAFHNTLFEKKIKPHGAPKFNSVFLADGKFLCEFEILTKPTFELQAYEGLKVPKPHESDSAPEFAEKMLQELRVKYGEAAPYTETEFVEHGDNVIVDYEGSIDGQALPNLSAVGEMLTVGSTNFSTFDDNILGMSLGETREFDVVIPDNSMPSLSNKTARLKVTLNMGSKNTPCPLDDTLATKLGKKDLTELRTVVQGTAITAVQNKIKTAINESVAAQLVDMHAINVPNWMSLSEAKYLVQHAKLNWESLSDSDKELYLGMAEKNVKLSLILDKIREDSPDAQLSDQEVFEIIKQNLAKTKVNQPIDEIIQQMNKSGYLQILFSRIRDEHAMDFVTKKVSIIE